ncbi:MAG: single-stranded DNA-binding protein [Deltaproteobacteria bacterium CG2_30_63_29]|nr:MAG: single-stranded DNA-binding protein [Deltaproteobacteria bacterium CG2_30_63_29]PJB38482.1 MAG: single-stranded DNA-binding protein [Deltaproteobacteria bacterium CG_4_9_14_3_um_filter_63_12]
MIREIAEQLVKEVEGLSFAPPVDRVYNPLVYARAPHMRYLERFGVAPKEVILVGMNPGPWGMGQTGVPFGAVPNVAEWLGINEPVESPANEHPKRPVSGFECPRIEVSGQRFWQWAADRFETPELFSERFFVWNFCPLMFLSKSGSNLTPDKLKVEERAAVEGPCGRALRAIVELLGPRHVIGVGAYAEKQIRLALQGLDGVEIGRILHPSPASPIANRGWAEQANKQFEELGIAIPDLLGKQ